MNSLWALIRFYDLMNRIMSFGQDIRLRREGILSGVRGGRVLDAGCGPGTMTKMLLKVYGSKVTEVCLVDPSRSMLHEAGKEVDKRGKICLESAVMENLPFQTGIFDAVVCGFSLRDAISTDIALAELFRVLKKNGRLLIVDLGKPDNRTLRAIIGVYWRFCVPFVARLVVREMGSLYAALYKTYSLYPKTSELRSLINEHTKKLVVKERLFGGVLIIIVEK